MRQFDPGLAVFPTTDPLGFRYGPGVFGPEPELRPLDAIRKSLLDPQCEGPEVVYAIAMDVGEGRHRAELERRMLLYGVVTYAAGRLGREPIRSQGHIHAVSKHSGWAPPELYEIWAGKAIIYVQERVQDEPGQCIAIHAEAGDTVLVPPGWAHCTISADPTTPLTFGAWCDREYGFEYDAVRAHRGLAFYPVWDAGALRWEKNPSYGRCRVWEKAPEDYTALGVERGVPIYAQFARKPEAMQFVSEPALWAERWKSFIP
ncbi:MAG: glucose-6-phosphate isomerase family protein [Candidatus Limiplasma sp.]|nr:glucose-6-phosphate isomerase family protein [Candidatus Limiplasma sp.]